MAKMSKNAEHEVVLRCSSTTASDAFHIAVSSAKLQSASEFYRALKTSGMSDANKTEFLIPDITERGLQLLADCMETPRQVHHLVPKYRSVAGGKALVNKFFFVYCATVI
jgi:hypothetical protein